MIFPCLRERDLIENARDVVAEALLDLIFGPSRTVHAEP
jgi:hypothetical protein